ncbi:MAG: biopolymer transporter ExbD [Terrimicrobiaceae bacterium]
MSESHSPRHKNRRLRKEDPEIEPEFQIAPMIDILLVLLVFFMSISTTEVLQSNKEINLPVAKEAKEAKENPGQVIINVAHNAINNSTVIEIDAREFPGPADMIALLDAKVKANPMVRVVVRADREVRYEFLRSILESVGKAGVGNVTFSVVDKDPNAVPPPAA